MEGPPLGIEKSDCSASTPTTMPLNPKAKRPAKTTRAPAKKRKLNDGQTKKEKASDRKTIPIPDAQDDDSELSEQDIELFGEYGGAVGFLSSLDRQGISKSKQEVRRIHELSKPVRQAPKHDDLPPIESDDDEEDEANWSSGIEDLDSNASESDSPVSSDSDVEMPYEKLPRKRRPSWDSDSKTKTVQGLPIKLPDGKVKSTGVRAVKPDSDSDSDSADEDDAPRESFPLREDGTTGARFGRPSVVNVLQTKSRKGKIQLAKDQIASICQDILADPQNSLGLVRRLHSFALAKITAPTHPDPIPNDPIIRKLAILSQLAVFKDIIPGYRIRELTEQEKSEKVSQAVAHQREWEQGLVTTYQTYLRLLEAELKVHSDLSETALYCMCTLLTDVTHFNFRVNLMTCIVARLSKKSWDQTSEMCSNALIKVFREDTTGTPSLEIVRLINRMVKERHFKVHRNALSCLLQLRLRTELGVRASDRYADRPQATKIKTKKKDRVYLSKKSKTMRKEQKEIDKEFREAEAVVDQEERKGVQTETLKLLFALYFRILKNSTPTPLLPSALSGISRFAHLVNIDFFKDLMKVLKELVAMEAPSVESEDVEMDTTSALGSIARRLMCILTAFELLTGQGEALDIDLGDFINHLYALLGPLSFIPDVDVPQFAFSGDAQVSITDLLFRVLSIIFSPRTLSISGKPPPWRSAAFAKRMLTVCLHWSPPAVLRTLDFVGGLIGKDATLEALLSTEDRIFNGVYRPDVDDPQLCQPFQSSFWELHVLRERHWDARVRAEAEKLLVFSPS